MGIKYFLTQKTEGVFINVTRDDRLMFPPSIDTVKSDLSLRRIPYDPHALEMACEGAKGEFIQISSTNQGYSLKPLVRVRVSQDKLKAYLILVPFLAGDLLTIADLEEALKEQKITHGIRREGFEGILENQKTYGEHIVAEGLAPVDGENARLVLYFDPKGIELKPQEMEDGSVDFYNLNLIQGITAGAVLVEKVPATEGKIGFNVFGEEIKARPGKDTRLPQGQNTQIVENNTKLIAVKDGHVVYVNGKVNVLSTYEVKGDVDFSTGNIRFNGNVVIYGNVRNGFEVEATGDVEVRGNLEGQIRTASNIQVKKGIVKGKAFAKGNIYARYIENSQAICGDSIVAADAIMHSITKAGNKVTVGGKKGLLVGGTCSAGQEIYAKTIGSPMGTSTTLEVGIRPELREEYKEVCRKLLQDQENQEKNQKLIKTLQEMKLSAGRLPESKNELFMKASRLQYQLHQEIEELSLRKEELEARLENLHNASIIGEKVICNGVIIYMGRSTFNVIEEMRQVIFTLDGLDIKHGTYVWGKRG